MLIVMWDPTKKENKSIICCHIMLHLLFVLHKGLMLVWFILKHAAKAMKENISCVLTDDLFSFLYLIWTNFIKQNLPCHQIEFCWRNIIFFYWEQLPFTLLWHPQMRIKFLWDVMLCHSVFGFQCFEGTVILQNSDKHAAIDSVIQQKTCILSSGAEHQIVHIHRCPFLHALWIWDISNLVPPHTQNFFTLHFEMIMSLTKLLSKNEVYFISWIITFFIGAIPMCFH